MVKQLLNFCLLFVAISASADDWMSRLKDDLLLTKVSIPGAHDAGTGNGFIPSQADWTKPGQTQGLTLAEQFHYGVRAYDLRPAAINSAIGTELLIFHGKRQTNISLDSALHMLIDSLKEHPTEFVIIVINHEAEADNDSPLWQKAVDALLNSDGISEYLSDYTPTLTVGELRGKVLVLSRQHYSDTLRGGLIFDWNFSDNLQEQMTGTIKGKDSEGKLYVQDFYDTTAQKIKTKLVCIKNMLATAQEAVSSAIPPLIINHSSGFSATIKNGKSGGATTEAYINNAMQTNAETITLLRQVPNARGIIVMDYAGIDNFNGHEVFGEQLTRAVIEQNFR